LATIHDVAHLAGVNHTTVSHTLSGKRPVAAATRERVLAAVRQLGYQPNATARSLVSRRTRTVGLVAPLDSHTPVLSNSSYAQFITSAADRLNAHDYRLLCFVARDADAADVIQLVRGGQVDGILLLQVRVDDARVTVLQEERLPFVAIGRPRHAAGVVRADADFANAAEIAVRHLVSLGHRHIAFLSVSQPGTSLLGYQHYGLAGFRRAHRALRLPLHRGYVLAHSPDGGVRAALAPLLRGDIEVTAMIATTPIEAVMAQHVLAEQGLRVPDHLSLVAINDSTLGELAQPPMTVVTFSPVELTCVAVDLLVGMLNGQQPAQLEHLVPVELVVRQSTRRISQAVPGEDPVREAVLECPGSL
jgi:DNA-binding LacI/PurR family transcriptional regulator